MFRHLSIEHLLINKQQKQNNRHKKVQHITRNIANSDEVFNWGGFSPF